MFEQTQHVSEITGKFNCSISENIEKLKYVQLGAACGPRPEACVMRPAACGLLPADKYEQNKPNH